METLFASTLGNAKTFPLMMTAPLGGGVNSSFIGLRIAVLGREGATANCIVAGIPGIEHHETGWLRRASYSDGGLEVEMRVESVFCLIWDIRLERLCSNIDAGLAGASSLSTGVLGLRSSSDCVRITALGGSLISPASVKLNASNSGRSDSRLSAM